jgi:hypothetical protein
MNDETLARIQAIRSRLAAIHDELNNLEWIPDGALTIEETDALAAAEHKVCGAWEAMTCFS